MYLEFLILACTIYILAPGQPRKPTITKGFDGLSCPSKVLFVEKLQEAGNPEGYM